MRAKTSSKRAQRKIDLGEGDFVAAKQADGILGGRIDGLHDEDIFFLDNCAPGNNLDTISRKKRARSKVSRVDAILARERRVKPFPVPVARKSKGAPASKYATKGANMIVSGSEGNKSQIEAKKAILSSGETTSNTSATATVYKPRKAFSLNDMVSGIDVPKSVRNYNLWNGDEKNLPIMQKPRKLKSVSLGAAGSASCDMIQLSHRPLLGKGSNECTMMPVKAMQTDAAGSSYNPPEDARQAVLAKEVAREVSKMLRRQLDPIKAPEVRTDASAWLINDLDCGNVELRAEHELDDVGEQAIYKATAMPRGKMTKAYRNKQRRRRERVAEEAANMLAKRQRRDLSLVKELHAEIVAAEDSGRDRLARRTLTRKGRAHGSPSRLGKHLYQPEPAPVLLTDELTGSLRTFAGTHTLLRDRLKNFQRRALVETRKQVVKTQSKNYLRYEPGAKGDREVEMHQEKLRAERVPRHK